MQSLKTHGNIHGYKQTLYNLGLATISDDVLLIVSSASFSILLSRTSHVGIS